MLEGASRALNALCFLSLGHFHADPLQETLGLMRQGRGKSGSPPSCLPGTEIKVITEIKGIQESKQPTLGGGTATNTDTSSCGCGEQTAPLPWAQQEGVQLLLGRSLSLCLSQPQVNQELHSFPLARSWPTGGGWVRTGGQTDSREGQARASV